MVHWTTLECVAGRGRLGYIFGCDGMMAYQKIAVSCDKSYSFMLDNFTKGAGGWGGKNGDSDDPISR